MFYAVRNSNLNELYSMMFIGKHTADTRLSRKEIQYSTLPQKK